MDVNKIIKDNKLDYKVVVKGLGALKKAKTLEEKQPKKIEKSHCSVNSKTNEVLGIVSNEFSPIQNETILKHIAPFIKGAKGKESKWGFRSKGNGSKYTLLIYDSKHAEVSKGDDLTSGVAVSWSHSKGKGGVSLSPFFERLICENGMVSSSVSTERVSLVEEDPVNYEKTAFATKFKKAFEAYRDEIREALDADVKQFKEWKKVKVTDKVAHEHSHKVFKIEHLKKKVKAIEKAGKDAGITDKAMLDRAIKKLKRAEIHQKYWESQFKSQNDNKGNLWGLYNSFTNWFSHGVVTSNDKGQKQRKGVLEVIENPLPRALARGESRAGLKLSLNVCREVFRAMEANSA